MSSDEARSAARCCYRSAIVLDFDKRETFRRCPLHGETEHVYQPPQSRPYRRRPWWRRHTIQHYRVWKVAYRLGLTKEPW